MLDFSENWELEVTQEDIRIIQDLERDERIIKAVHELLLSRRNKD